MQGWRERRELGVSVVRDCGLQGVGWQLQKCDKESQNHGKTHSERRRETAVAEGSSVYMLATITGPKHAFMWAPNPKILQRSLPGVPLGPGSRWIVIVANHARNCKGFARQ